MFAVKKTLWKLKSLLKISSLPDKDTLKQLLLSTESILNDINSHLPVFYLRKNNTHLKYKYNSSEIEEELAHPEKYSNSLLHDLVSKSNLSADEFVAAAQPGSSPLQTSLRDYVKERIRRYINIGFSTVYKTEWTYFDVDFNGGYVIFSMKTEDGVAMPLNERSDGLKYFLDLYIDVSSRSSISPRKSVVYLIDEPGTSLHADAQKDLLQFFHD